MRRSVSYSDSFSERVSCAISRRKFLTEFYRLLSCFLSFSFSLLFFKNFILSLIFVVFAYIFYTVFFDHSALYFDSRTLNVWFGVPGSGKTSIAALLTRFTNKIGISVLSNVPISGAYQLDVSDLGKYDMSFNGLGCHVIIDEASSYFDNRGYKDFYKSPAARFFSLHRHMGVRVDILSQGYDVDKRIRDRASDSGLFYLKKIGIPGFVCYRRISRVLTINKEDKQIIDGFKFSGLPRLIYSRSVWRSFDSFDKSLCPRDIKDWSLWP